MNHFETKAGVLSAEDLSLEALADAHGTPLYVYSAATLRRHARLMQEALAAMPGLVCYAVKACSNLGVLSLLAKEGVGFDIVSGGELERVLAAGGRADRVVFSGVGKQQHEIERALREGIKLFNVESAPELELIAQVATSLGKRAPIAVRVNPEVDAKTHPYIATGLKESKFGLPIDDAVALYRRAAIMDGIEVAGVAFHIGSQITALEPFGQAIDRVLALVATLRGERMNIRVIDVGGGLGVPYAGETPPSPSEYGKLVREKLANAGAEVLLEPGRVLVANAGVLVTRVLYVKKTAYKTFVVVDAAMNDLMRPALYQAHHHIEPVRSRGGSEIVDVVGPVCESSDFFAKARALPVVEAGDLLCIRTAGAYGFSMASQYNTRPRAAEIIVSGDRAQLVRERESVESLWRGESRLDPSM